MIDGSRDRGPTRSRWRVRAGWVALLGLVGPAACSFEELTTAETDVVVTVPGEGRSFEEFKTYALPDQVTDLCDAVDEDSADGPLGFGGEGGRAFGDLDLSDCKEVSHRHDDLVLDTIAEQMDALGYRRIEDPDAETPDVVILAGWVAQENYFMGTTVGWCDPYYYYYGCWYPSYSYVYTLPTSALVLDMIVVDESSEGELASAWFFAAQGLYEQSSELSTEERITRAIETGFAQSPYLGEGGE